VTRRHGGAHLPEPPHLVRSVGLDDAPFVRVRGGGAHLAGVVCCGTRFEGMVWGRLRQDGWDSTEVIARLLVGGKFLPQLHLVLLDGISFGGFNVVDLPALAARLSRPCVAVMRRAPDLAAVERVLQRLPDPRRRLRVLGRAGPVHARPPFHFQVAGGDPDEVAGALARLTDRGHVPEPLRLAHLIGAAVRLGESGRRA